MKNDTTKDAYKLAAALLQYNMEKGVVEILLKEDKSKSEQEKKEIVKALENLIASLSRQAR